MRSFSINKLSYIYEKILKKNKLKKIFYYGKFNHLNLSIFQSRDEREFDIANYKLLKSLIFSEKINLGKINKGSYNSYIKYYFNIFKEFDYLYSHKLYLIILKDIFKFLKQIFDTLILISCVLILSIYNTIFRNNSKNIISKKRIYSIFYWNEKGQNSASYYYPNIVNENNSIAFIASFADCKNFLSLGLLHSIKNFNYYSPANIISFNGFIRSLFQFLHLFLNDLSLGLFKKDYEFIRFWYGWKKCTEIFYSVLVYNSLLELITNSKNCEFISWYENQITNKAFSLAVSYSKIKLNSSSSLSTFNGSPISINNKKQYMPFKEEIINGLWGEKYYVQDAESMIEMKSYFTQKQINLKLEITSDLMSRSKEINENLSLNITPEREITIFTHDSYWDMIACILSIFNKNNKFHNPTELVNQTKFIYIRLHPALNKKDALNQLLFINEIPKNIKFQFINNKLESISLSIKKTLYSYFGHSSYINLALAMQANVIAVNTIHTNKISINSRRLNSNNLHFADPW